ncbi:mitochondrial-processing peptidase subunit alpha-like isoform X2 [Mizuhopecten yessoensis]|uniref:mitochondrial-processing peptidase subunit alpha-like isoform X1 n=1 Tax=Mizuhopecten yessoensis TaxID=6573 RepID=UPI000B45DF56|nr:mitochondrial-processing peptidase subunit alpha-like isoform X1 [Mizuhopecten yessoensis]XP_021367244.1 mitochondrial-processing peptidase subunit alpha-like isoform X2 [Mizuhopecten yessoensis]
MATPMWTRTVRQGCCRLCLLQNVKPRKFSSKGQAPSGFSKVSLSKRLPGLPLPKYATVENQKQVTQVTTLENGLRVASENKFGHFCTVGVLVDSGSRYEVAYPSGISHVLEKLAFNSTTQYSREQIFEILEKHGGITDCMSARDTLIYAMSAESTALPLLSNILAEVTLRPQFTEQEIEDTRNIVEYELESVETNPQPEPILIELSHAAAYQNNTLGLPKLCPKETIPIIDRSTLLSYMYHHHTPDRMVVAGVGVDHQQFVEAVKESFLNKQPVWQDDPKLIHPSAACDKSVAQYTGGDVRVNKDLSDVSLGPNPMPDLAHLVIGLESCSHKEEDFVAFCVLNILLGGGSSFSSGGPGKGMYTRLYTNVLNRYHWINSASAVNNAYEDTGFFCIHCSSHPDRLGELAEVIIQELCNTAGNIRNDELERAKTQLQSMLLMNLEMRPVMFEDVGRQVLANGYRRPVEYYFEAIGKITAADVQRVGSRMLKTKLSVAAYGNLKKLPSYEDMQSLLSGKTSFYKQYNPFRMMR